MAGRNIVTLQGTLQAGPAKSTDCAFPSALVNASFTLKPSTKAAPVSAYDVRNLNSPSSFVQLRGVGPGESVTRGNTLYLRTETAMTVRATFDDGVGGSVVATYPVDGLFVIEAQEAKFIKLLEAQGVGVVEYFASGNL
jgi:hypothetical protein